MGGFGSGTGTAALGGAQREKDRAMEVRSELGSIMNGARPEFSCQGGNGQVRDVLGRLPNKGAVWQGHQPLSSAEQGGPGTQRVGWSLGGHGHAQNPPG